MKSKTTALLLTFLLGALGAGNFYLGNMKSGVAQLILFVLGFFTLFIAWIPLG
ncbi:MAG: NINE protein, partial [Paludibacteraceae bacterium]|nr:NINE protein [Paludibacteraceae bacterium]